MRHNVEVLVAACLTFYSILYVIKFSTEHAAMLGAIGCGVGTLLLRRKD